jgi:hypothetical protein
LHRGNQLNLNVYSRAELRGSDHKPGLKRTRFSFTSVNFDAVFAIYDAEVRIIDRVKKAALSQMLLESIITFTEPGEMLDKKFANLVLPANPRQCMNLITLHS